MKNRLVFLCSITATIIINLCFVISIKYYPQVVYGYSSHTNFNIRYPSTTEEESRRRGCLISRYQDETGLKGFIEYGQFWKGKTLNSQYCLFFILDIDERADLRKEVFLEPGVMYQKRKYVCFEISDKDHPVLVPDTLVLRTRAKIIVLIKDSE